MIHVLPVVPAVHMGHVHHHLIVRQVHGILVPVVAVYRVVALVLRVHQTITVRVIKHVIRQPVAVRRAVVVALARRVAQMPTAV